MSSLRRLNRSRPCSLEKVKREAMRNMTKAILDIACRRAPVCGIAAYFAVEAPAAAVSC
jgi:methylthioribose-1-phosphate isomerase